MDLFHRIKTLIVAAIAVGAFSLPAVAQQRIPISDLIQRIDRLETEVVRLRVSRGTGGGDVARLDLIEQELRRLTGQVERFDFETRRAETERAKRLDAMETRLEALESSRNVASAPAPDVPSFSREPTFPGSQFEQPTDRPAVSEFGQQPAPSSEIYQPESTFQPQTETAFQQPFGAQPAPASFPTADGLYDEGVRLLNVGSFDQAGAQFEDLIATYPEDPKAGQAQFWLGDMHFKLGRFEQAAAAFLDSLACGIESTRQFAEAWHDAGQHWQERRSLFEL